MIRKLFFLLICLFFFTGFAQLKHNQDDWDNYHQALKFGSEGRFALARDFFKLLPDTFWESEEIRMNLQVIEDLFAERISSEAAVYFFKAMEKSRSAEREDAIALLSYAVNENPDYAPFYFQRASVFYELDFNDEALDDFNKALKFDLGNSRAYYKRGVIFKRKRELLKALCDLTKSLEIDSL
ncbi:MAG: hypothetical protein P8184_20945, partial [Calditrichia bacterium]